MDISSVFEKIQKPIPCQDQSVAGHVGLVLSKILTPLAISAVIAALTVGQGYHPNKTMWLA